MDRVHRKDVGSVPTQGRCTEEETALDIQKKSEIATLEGHVLVCFLATLSIVNLFRTINLSFFANLSAVHLNTTGIIMFDFVILSN